MRVNTRYRNSTRGTETPPEVHPFIYSRGWEELWYSGLCCVHVTFGWVCVCVCVCVWALLFDLSFLLSCTIFKVRSEIISCNIFYNIHSFWCSVCSTISSIVFIFKCLRCVFVSSQLLLPFALAIYRWAQYAIFLSSAYCYCCYYYCGYHNAKKSTLPASHWCLSFRQVVSVTSNDRKSFSIAVWSITTAQQTYIVSSSIFSEAAMKCFDRISGLRTIDTNSLKFLVHYIVGSSNTIYNNNNNK